MNGLLAGFLGGYPVAYFSYVFFGATVVVNGVSHLFVLLGL